MPPAPMATGPGSGPQPGGGGTGKRPSTALIAGIAGAVVVVIAIVVVLVVVLGGEKKPVTGAGTGGGATAPSTSPSGGDTSQAKQAAGILVGQVAIPPGEYQCVVDALEGDSALADAVVGGTPDSTAVADMLVSCVSSGTVADAVTKDMAGQYPASSIACLNANIASMDQSSLSQLMQAVLEGDVQSAQGIVSYAAAGC